MWPWEHLAVAYIAVSLAARARGYRVDRGIAGAVLLGSQVPDLVDKPLAWAFGVLPSGTTLAHSVFVAVPSCVVVWVVCRRYGRAPIGLAFAAAYLLHLPGDVLYATTTVGEPPYIGAVLWPLVPRAPGDAPTGLAAETLRHLTRYRHFLADPAAGRYLVFETVLLVSALVLWVHDGRPGLQRAGRQPRTGTTDIPMREREK